MSYAWVTEDASDHDHCLLSVCFIKIRRKKNANYHPIPQYTKRARPTVKENLILNKP